MALEVFANQPSTTVSSGGTDAPASGTVETWTVASSLEFPAASSSATPPTQFHVADALASASSELITVTNISGSTWTVTRGAEGTTPVVHVAGFTIYQVVTAGGMQQASRVDWLNVVTMFGADPTGTSDSTAAFTDAVAALPATGGVIYVPAGTYKVSSTVTVPQAGVYFQGDGRWATIISYTGSGDCIRMYSTTSYQPGDTAGGGLIGLTIDGTSASAGAAGFHIGDIYNLEFDCGVRSFQGTGSKGAWLDNNYWWAEQMHGRIWAEENTQNVVFDNSANTSGSATNSFARTILDVMLNAKGVGDGVVLNYADLYNSRIGIYGNIDYGGSQHYVLNITGGPSYSFTATDASPCVFTASGSYFPDGAVVTLSGASLPAGFTAQSYYVVSASGTTFELSATSGGSPINSSSTGSGTVQAPYSRIYTSQVNLGVECNGTSGTQPITINFGTAGGNAIRDCTGILDFSASAAMASAVNSSGGFDFDGPVLGDATLQRVIGAGMAAYSGGTIGNNAFLTTRYNNMITAQPSGNVTGAILGSNDPGSSGSASEAWANRTVTVVNRGTGSITFAATSTSHVSTGTLCVIAAGMAMTFVWTSNSSTWYPVT